MTCQQRGKRGIQSIGTLCVTFELSLLMEKYSKVNF